MKASLLIIAAALSFAGCNKMAEAIIDKGTSANPSGQFTKFTISKGQHYCNGNAYKVIEDDEIRFSVKFDSSAIYQTLLEENQYDINKLFGFSDNNTNHHQFSARFGWRWSDSALRLFAYVYNNGEVISRELTTIAIGREIHCSISINGSKYLFLVNETAYEMPRMSSTDKAIGYQLYPYFGGDEPAPHDICIFIRQLD